MMKIHPLFAGFVGQEMTAVGAALGFDLRVVTTRAPLLPLASEGRELVDGRFADAGGLAAFSVAGSWHAPGVFCTLFARPLTPLALVWWLVGLRGFALEPRGATPALAVFPLDTLAHGVADVLAGSFDYVSRGYLARCRENVASAVRDLGGLL